MNETNRNQALEKIRRLALQFDLTLQDIERCLTEPPSETTTASVLLVKVLSYIGGIFVFAGIAAFIALQWEGMNSAARIIITLGSGCGAFVLALLALREPQFTGLTMPLLFVAAVLQPTGMMVAFAELGSGGDEQMAALITAATFAVQFGATFARWRQTMVLWLTLFFASAAWGLFADLIDMHGEAIGLTMGVAWLSGGLICQRGRRAALSAQLYFFGSWALLASFFEIVRYSAAEPLFVVAACAMIYLGVGLKSRVLNLAATVALLAYTAYFTGRHFADSMGWPLVLILIGLLMLGISTVALRIDRRYLR